MSAELIKQTLTLFKGNTKRVMKQNDDKGYGILHIGALTENDLNKHLSGEISVALYLLNENELCSAICFDIDIPKVDIPEHKNEREKIKEEQFLPEVKKIIQYIQEKYEVPNDSFLVEDTGGRGYHIWLFLENPIEAEGVVIFARDVKINAGFSNLEIFPPNFKNGKTGFSKSLVRLPLGIHRKYNGARSFFLNINDSYQMVSFEDSLTHLKSISFTEIDVIEKSKNIFQKTIDFALKEDAPISDTIVHSAPRKIVGQIGNMCHLCPALSGLISKVERESHLLHHERFALGVILNKFSDGETALHTILSNCSDYDKEYSQTQINSLEGYNALSCKTLQSEKYKICAGWCNSGFKNSFDSGKSPSPLWFSKLEERKDKIQLDNANVNILERIASFENLYHSWQQAKIQLIERDVFEDNLSYRIFEKNLWANLSVIRSMLLNKTWKHEPFTLINVPKSKDDLNTRPSTFSAPIDTIVDLAVLNIIAPNIDSLFHKNSLGNRIATSPKIDSEIFIDWRKQNYIRELKKQGFSNYDSEAHYILTDIKKFYEFIQHDKLMSIVRIYIDDQKVLDIIQQYIEAPWTDKKSNTSLKRTQGIPQGPAFSAFLANLYLNEIDVWIGDNSLKFVRYVDDIAILFPNKTSAIEGLRKLKLKLENDLGLEISEEKTTEPISADNIELLKDWLDEARYDIVKSSSPSTSLTFAEKIEFQNALKRVTGIDTGDRKRLTKYLGFYIKFTEKLDDLEIQQGVYAIALQILNEERPKHNTTSIAMAALIKACNEFGDSAWVELKKLLDNRTDEYVKIVLCQESRRFLNRTEQGALHPKLIEEIYAIAINEKEPIASAAALSCLEFVEDFNKDTADIFNVALGKNKYIRYRALHYLYEKDKINTTTLTRFIPETLFELQVLFFTLEKIPNKNIIDSLSEKITTIANAEYSFPSLLYISIYSKSVSGVKSILQNTGFNSNFFVSIIYYISKRIVEEILRNPEASNILNELTASFNSDETNLVTKELYKLGKSALIINENKQYETLLNINGTSQNNRTTESFSLVKKGLIPIKLAFSNYTFLQIAKDDIGNEHYHEIISDNELRKIDKKVSDYKKVVDLLNGDALILFDSYETKIENGINYFLISLKKSKDWKCLNEWMDEQENITIDQILNIINKAAIITNTCRNKVLKELHDDYLAPVPNSKTLFINDDFELKFGNISISNCGEKTYFGIEDKQNLPKDEWAIYSLGLLFFELRTKNCAVKSLSKNNSIDKEKLNLYKDGQGALFLDIIRKATFKNPEERYKMFEHFIKEVYEWGVLEKSLIDSNVPSNRLRSLWQLDIYSDRFALSSYLKSGSILCLCPNIAISIIHNMKDLLAEEWLKNKFTFIKIDPENNKHIASLQAISIAEGVFGEINKYKIPLNLIREISLSDWLSAAAATIEIESLRRSIYYLLQEKSVNSELNLLVNQVEAALKQNQKTTLFSNATNADTIETISFLEDSLGELVYRMKFFLSKKLPEANWRVDLLVITFVLIVYDEGITYKTDAISGVIKKRKVYVSRDIKLIVRNLMSIFQNDFYHTPNINSEQALRKIKYSLKTVTKCLSNDLNVSKRVYRRHNTLEKDYSGALIFRTIDIKIHGNYKKILKISRMHIPTSFEYISSYTNISGCPFSVDFIELKDKSLVPLTFTLPPVVRFDTIEQYPMLEKRRFDYPMYNIIQYRRKNPVTSSVLDFHLLFLCLMIGFFFISTSYFTDFESASQQFFLNVIIYFLAPACMIAYFRIVGIRLIKHYKLDFLKILKSND